MPILEKYKDKNYAGNSKNNKEQIKKAKEFNNTKDKLRKLKTDKHYLRN